MMTDPIADLLTRVRNANAIRAKSLDMPASRTKVAIAQVLVDEGFIKAYEVKPGQPSSTLRIELKYSAEGQRVIRTIQRVSKPGCRVYCSAKRIPKVLRGMGIQILSTPVGILSDRAAREQNVGGEVLAKVT
jgi:small subunit ribosomal protein S8